jgi:hypothetical protein
MLKVNILKLGTHIFYFNIYFTIFFKKKYKDEFNSQNYDYNPGEDEFIENKGEYDDSDSISKHLKNKIKDEFRKGFGWFKNKVESKIDKIGK